MGERSTIHRQGSVPDLINLFQNRDSTSRRPVPVGLDITKILGKPVPLGKDLTGPFLASAFDDACRRGPNQLCNNPISNSQLSNPISNSQLSNSPIPNSQLSNNPKSNSQLSDNPIPSSPISNGLLSKSQIPNSQLSNNQLSNNPKPNSQLSNSQLSSNPISNSKVSNSHVSNSSKPNSHLTSSPMSNNPISSNHKSNSQLSNNPIPNCQLSNNPISNSQLSSNPLSNRPISSNPLSNRPISSSPISSNPLSNSPKTSPGYTIEKEVSTPTLSSNVNTDKEEWVVFVGFPSSIQSDQVAECVSKATGARVNKVAPLNMVPASDRSLPSSWIASLQTHNDEMDWSIQNEITVECCGQTCTIQCKPLTLKNVQVTPDSSNSPDLTYENQFSLKAQDLQNQHLLITSKSTEGNTADTQESLVDIGDTQVGDDLATLYFPNHKIRYKTNWKWDEQKQELCVQAVDCEETGCGLEENRVTADLETSQDGESPICCTVEVQGFEPHETELCRQYFENSLEDGEREIVHLSVCEDKMYITFKTSKAAEQVSERSHQCISGRNVQVSRLTPPCVYPNMLLLKNVRGFTKLDHLTRYMEIITGFQPQDTVLGEQPGVILVKFEESACIDFQNITELCKTTKLQGQQLSFSQVPVSNCMIVENLAPGSTEKDVLVFLKSFIPPDFLTDEPVPAVERVKLITKENKCFVFFKDFKVIDKIKVKSITWNCNDWIIKHYMQCLEANGDCEMFTTFIKPEAFILSHDDPYKMVYVQHSQKAQEELMIQLLPLHAKLKIDDNSVIVDCTLTSSIYRAHALARTWAHFVQLAINRYMNHLEVYKLKILHSTWQEIETYVKEVNQQNDDDTIFFMQLTRRVVIVVGKGSARDRFQQLVETVRNLEAEIKSKEIRETEIFLKRFQLQLLKILHYQDKIKMHNNGITVDICPDKRGISFTGFPDDVKMAQIEMIRVLNLVKSCSMADKSRTYRHILSSNQTCELLAKKWSDENIIAVLDTSEDNIMIYALSDNETRNARRCILETIVEHVYSLNRESIHLLSSEEWHYIIQTHLFRNPGKLHISNCKQPHQFLLTGTIDIMDDVIKSIDDFVNENTVYSEEYCLSPSRQKFVTIHMRDKLKLIAASLTKYKVEIFQVKERDEVIFVKGTMKGLNLMMTKLQSLGQQIPCHITIVDDLARMEFFTKDNNTHLDLFERSSKCVVGFINEPNVLQVVKSSRYDEAGDVCFVGDMKICGSVQLSEGVTIFLVQGEVSHMMVVAIVSETNDQMENFKKITGSTASYGDTMSEGEIITSGPGQLSCKHVIYAVSILYINGKSGEDKRLFETITNCLETADTLGCTSIALPALGSSTCSSNYPLTECTSVVVEAVRTYMEIRSNNNLSEIYLCAHDSDCMKHFSTAMQNASADSKIRKSDLSFMIKPPRIQNRQPLIRVIFLNGNIAKQQADVIVNSTSFDLNLSNGAVSSSILAAGGLGLQDECRTKYPQGIPIGGIARTSGHDLCCKEVFHVALCNFKSPKAQQILESLVNNCLKEASESKYSTLAFPALGSGILGYPLDVVSSTMFRAIDTFKKATPCTTITDVMVVVLQDKEVIKEFLAEYERTYKQLPESESSLETRFHYQTFSEFPSNSEVLHTRASTFWIGSFECVMCDLRVMIKQADITEEHVDAIVNCTNDDMDLNAGVVSRILKAKCGNDLEAECKEKVTDMQTNGICSTNAFNLKCKIILHVSFSRYHADMEGGVKVILKEADKLSLCSIAFPALGTGGDPITPEESAKAMFRAMIKFCKGKRQTLNEVRVILPDNSAISPFVSVIQAKSEKLKSRLRGIGKFFKGKKERTSLSAITMVNSFRHAVKLYVYAVDKNDVKRLLDDVGLVKPSQLKSIIRKKKDLTLLVEPYADDKTSQENITTLPAVVHLPTSWTDQGPEEKVKRCPLMTSDQEYKTIEKNFRVSLRNMKISIVTIERIQNPDLYTHYMHKRKQMESQNSDIHGIPNERILWHGTDFAAIPCINHHGFNRSYCGKNATAYGEGVYFAVHSHYSLNPLYSPKDTLGRRYIYQCKVLTGHATTGKVGLKVLPSRSGVILYDSATDSLERPKLFVIFNDYQAYPEYLITYTSKD